MLASVSLVKTEHYLISKEQSATNNILFISFPYNFIR